MPLLIISKYVKILYYISKSISFVSSVRFSFSLTSEMLQMKCQHESIEVVQYVSINNLNKLNRPSSTFTRSTVRSYGFKGNKSHIYLK